MKIILITFVFFTSFVFGQRQVPSGGTAGQSLNVKSDGFNLQWSTLASPTGATGATGATGSTGVFPNTWGSTLTPTQIVPIVWITPQ